MARSREGEEELGAVQLPSSEIEVMNCEVIRVELKRNKVIKLNVVVFFHEILLHLCIKNLFSVCRCGCSCSCS